MNRTNKLIAIIVSTLIICLFIVASVISDMKKVEEEMTTDETNSEIEVESEVATEEAYSTETTSRNIFEEVAQKDCVEENEDNSVNPVNLGTFKLTAYCNCSICCGKWAGGATASGAMPKANHTIAVDTNVIPFGTSVIINGETYVAEDTGSAIQGNKIDIFFDSHQEALNFGVQYAEVFKTNS